MKFNCDYFKNKREARQAASYQQFLDEQAWHKVYTIWPVKVGPNDCRMFEYIEQRIVLDPLDRARYGEYYCWQVDSYTVEYRELRKPTPPPVAQSA